MSQPSDMVTEPDQKSIRYRGSRSGAVPVLGRIHKNEQLLDSLLLGFYLNLCT